MIEYLLNPQSIEALGWTLLHSVWQGAAFAFLLVVILIALRSYSAQSRYVVSVGLLCAFFLTLAGTFYLQWQDANVAAASAIQLLKEQKAQEFLVIDNGLTIVQGSEGIINSSYSGESLAIAQSSWLTSFGDYYNQHLPLLVTIWFLGVLFLQLRFLGQLAYIQRLKHYGAKLFPGSWTERIEELEGKLRIQKKVGYLISIRVESPMVIGWLRPVILIPQQLFNSLSETEIYTVLAHELAHIRREDFIVNLIQTFLCNVFFFHPGVWWMSNRIDDEREHCCDDLAVAATGPATSYAKTLINVSALQLKMQGSPALAMALAGKKRNRDRGGFSDRIRRLFMTNSGAGSFREGFATALILVTVLFLGAAATGSTVQTTDATGGGDPDELQVLPVDGTEIALSSEDGMGPPIPLKSSSSVTQITPVCTKAEGLDEEVLSIGTPVDTTVANGEVLSDDTRIDALVMACREGDVEFVITLVKSGIDIEGIGSNGVTPLIMAVSHEEVEIVDYLLKQGADVNQTYNNWTALIEAADEGSMESMKLLLKAGADVHYYEGPGSPTAMSMAASEGNLNCLQLLLRHGADIDGIGRSIPPLHIAAAEDEREIVDYLIAQKVNVNSQDASGRTALMHAASEGKQRMVTTLVEAGADISIVDGLGATAADYAANEREYSIRDYLEGEKENNNNHARWGKDDDDFKNDWNKDEIHDMHQATWDGHIEKVQRMVEQGGDVNSKDDVGRTPLHIAAAEGNDLDMRVLLSIGADLNAQDGQGRTPLMYAAADGKGDAVALLVSMRANVDLEDADGMRAYEWAQSGGDSELASFLGLITKEKSRSVSNESRRNNRTEENEIKNRTRTENAEMRKRTQDKRSLKQQAKRVKSEMRIDERTDARTDVRTDVRTSVITDLKQNVHTDVQTNAYKSDRKAKGKSETFHVAADGVHLRQFNLTEKTPELLEAVRSGNLQKCSILISNGLSPNKADDTGQTALMVAASTNQLDIAKMLIEQGADVNMSSISGLTALHYAALENHNDIAQLLLNNNANIDATMRYSSTDGNYSKEPLVWEYIGATPLLIAVEAGRVEMVAVLIGAGANTRQALRRNEYRLSENRKSYLSGGEVMGIDNDFLQDASLINSDNAWTPHKQALHLNKPEILAFFPK